LAKHTTIKSSLALLLCIIAGVVCYGQSLYFPFLEWDDQVYIINDPAIQTWSWHHLYEIWTTFHQAAWYPLTRSSHAIAIGLFGHDAFYHRAISLAIHILNGYLVYSLSSTLFKLRSTETESTEAIADPSFFLASAAALIFICHPQHVEVVVWLTQRNELLATAFILLSLIQYVSAIADKNNSRRYLSLLFFILAMISKPTAIGLPVLLIILDLIVNDKYKNWPNDFLPVLYRSLADKAPYIIISAVAYGISLHAHASSYAIKLHDIYSLTQRLCFSAYNMLDFIYRFFIPLHLTPLLEIPGWIQTISLRSFFPLISLALILTLAGLVFWRRKNALPLLILAYMALVLPGSGLIMIGTYSPGDRYMYLSSSLLIIFILACCYKPFIKSNAFKFYCSVPFAVILLFFSHITLTQAAHWKNDISLWEYVTKQQPRAATALTYLALQKMTHQMIAPQEAARLIEEAITIEPVYVGLDNLLKLYTALGDRENLLRTHEKIIAYYPSFSGASRVTVGIDRLQKNNPDEGKKLILEGIRIDPTLCVQMEQQLLQPANNASDPVYIDLEKIIQQARSEKRCP